ncbi:NADH-quinone oxidoreductase subunit K [Psychrobacter piechaudii]|uniref:NADH-quinone oxidoreductase subunit K n=1 Tax=Psychrobacter piechaudii TaxID=1945521 RepID=A0A1R4GD39_9GAMM|nr:NADH-quinone oxidoreductase subunit K [Psychrobacter piechaudii]
MATATSETAHSLEGAAVNTANPDTASVQSLQMKSVEMVQGTPNNTVVENSILGPIPMEHGLILAGIIFAIGLCGVMVRRNFLFMLMSLEIMMSAAGLAFIVAGSHWLSADGQVMFIFILTLAAAEASLGLAILLQFYHRRGHLDIDSANEMRG